MKITNKASQEKRSLSLFFVHAPQDALLLQDLEKHMSPLVREGLISTKSKNDILAGTEHNAAIEEYLDQAHIILLLISANLISSDYYYSITMSALQRKEEGRNYVVSILLRPIDWEKLLANKLPLLPSNRRPVSLWPDRDEVFTHIAREIRKIVYTLNHTLDERNVTQNHFSYLYWLIKRLSFLDTRGISPPQRSLQLKLEKVYIPLNARVEDYRVGKDKVTLLKNTEEPPGNASLIQPLPSILANHDHLVILGEPGSGKTTLLRYLALSHAQVIHDRKDAEVGEALFPIFLRIADYVKHGMSQGKSLIDYLADDCRRQMYPSSQLVDLLNSELQAGRCLVLLDGLDEVVRADDRRLAVQQIEDFIRCYDEVPNRFVLTSRCAGYYEVPFNASFALCTLQGLEDTDIQSFLAAWVMAVKGAVSPGEERESIHLQLARNNASGFLAALQAAPNVRRLASNPLLLRILVQLYRTDAPLPPQRAELYENIMETLVETWRVAQGVSASALTEVASLFNQSSTRFLLSKLAYWMHSKSSGGIVHEREAYRELGQEWSRLTNRQWYEEDPTIEQNVRHFLHAVRDHTGILVEDTPHLYRFAHNTFEEYYAARYLIANSQERAKRIRAHLHDWRWQEPILLALGLVKMESPEQACLLFESAILAQGEEAKAEGFDPAPYESLLGQDYLFALRCLGEEVSIRPALARCLVERLLREMTQQTGSGRFQKYQDALAEHLGYIEASSAASILLPSLRECRN